jgi:hypothetical protein
MIRDTGQPVPHKGCNSSSCCSPAKLWRTLQTLIKNDSKMGLVQFFKDDRLEHIVRVALTSRITNDAALLPPSQKHKIIRLTSRESFLYLGKSFTDLNLLQLALLCSSEGTVMALLNQLKVHASESDLKQFVNHVWGQGNTSLHLAMFLKRPLVIKALMDLGCVSGVLNARNKTAVDCCMGDQDILDIIVSRNVKKVQAQAQAPAPMPTPTPSPKPVAAIVIETVQPMNDETTICTDQQQSIDPIVTTMNDQQHELHVNIALVQSCLLTCMKQHLIGTFSLVSHSKAQLKKPPDITMMAC